MVVYVDGKPLKRDYRRFKLKDMVGPNDYASMEQVLMGGCPLHLFPGVLVGQLNQIHLGPPLGGDQLHPASHLLGQHSGEGRLVIKLANQNAREEVERATTHEERRNKLLEALGKMLSLETAPKRTLAASSPSTKWRTTKQLLAVPRKKPATSVSANEAAITFCRLPSSSMARIRSRSWAAVFWALRRPSQHPGYH